MPRILNALKSKVSSWFNRSRPKAPKLNARVFGHRGVAAGSVPKRAAAGGVSEAEITYGQAGTGNIGVEATRAAFTPEEIEKFEILTPNDVEAFVTQGLVLNVSSSNVCAMQYLNDTNQLIVEYGAGSGCGGFYLYQSVTAQEALTLAQANSKGGACWDLLRIRGTKFGHKKPYSKTSGFVKTSGRFMREKN